MPGSGEPSRPPDGRQADLERLAPGTGIGARLDRGAWSAMSQGAPGTWSWPRALGTVALAIVVGVVIYATIYREPAFLIGLALVYCYVLVRARVAHERYMRRTASR